MDEYLLFSLPVVDVVKIIEEYLPREEFALIREQTEEYESADIVLYDDIGLKERYTRKVTVLLLYPTLESASKELFEQNKVNVSCEKNKYVDNQCQINCRIENVLPEVDLQRVLLLFWYLGNPDIVRFIGEYLQCERFLHINRVYNRIYIADYEEEKVVYCDIRELPRTFKFIPKRTSQVDEESICVGETVDFLRGNARSPKKLKLAVEERKRIYSEWHESARIRALKYN